VKRRLTLSLLILLLVGICGSEGMMGQVACGTLVKICGGTERVVMVGGKGPLRERRRGHSFFSLL